MAVNPCESAICALRAARIARGKDRAIRNRFLQQLRIVFLGGDVALQENVRMGINETGQHRGLGKIYNFHTCGRVPSRRNGNDFVTFNYDQRVLKRFITLSVDQVSGADSNAVWHLAEREHWHCETQTKRNKRTIHEMFLPQERKAYQSRRNSSRPSMHAMA